jgi:D-sedoheptulose 7-phosphate isomerase
LKEFIRNNFAEAQKTLDLFVADEKNMQSMDTAVEALALAYQQGHHAFSCGNGGSMCDAMHFAEELTGRFRNDRPALAAMAISDPSHLTCVTNDYGPEYVFSRIIEAWGQSGDVLLAISTSGNSPNVIKAVQAARAKKMKIIGLLGKGGGKLASQVDFPLIVPSQVSDRIQEVHIKIIHTFIEGVERVIFPSHYPGPS